MRATLGTVTSILSVSGVSPYGIGPLMTSRLCVVLQLQDRSHPREG